MILQGKDYVNSMGRVSACCLGVKKEEGGELPLPDLRTTGEADRISARRQITSRSLWRLFVFSEILTCKNWQINSNFRETKESLASSFFFRTQKKQPCRSCLITVPGAARMPAKEDQDSCRYRKNDMLMWPA